MHRIVEPEREHLPRSRHRRVQCGGVERVAAAGIEPPCPVGERVPVVVDGLWIAWETPVAAPLDVQRALAVNEREPVFEASYEHLAQVYTDQ